MEDYFHLMVNVLLEIFSASSCYGFLSRFNRLLSETFPVKYFRLDFESDLLGLVALECLFFVYCRF